jgi:DNA repair protein RadC
MSENDTVAYRPMLRDLPSGERPRERLEHYGAGSLSTAEVLAIILRVGTDGENVLHVAEKLLARYSGLPGLAQATIAELCEAKGVGPAKAIQIKAALELGRRLLVAAPHERPTVRSPADAANLLMAEMALLPQEHLRTVLLDTRNRVLSIPTIYIGSLNSAAVRVGEVFREAIRANSAAMLVVHNHPSGAPRSM